jgi:L-malate glycosyltransferase
MKRKIAFITTMSGYPWGGSEYLWSITAEHALSEGFDTFVSLYDWSLTHPQIMKLQSKGAHLLPRVRFPKPPSVLRRIINKSSKYLANSSKPNAPYQPIFDLKPDAICISQGSSYDIAYIPDLEKLLRETTIPFSIVCQFNSDNHSPNYKIRSTVKEIFRKAIAIFFVSEQNLKLAERQLAEALPNALVVQNPVNIRDLSALSYPNSSKVCFAVVARLDTTFKGQDVLFETLSSPHWKNRDWQCNLYGTGPDKDYLKTLARHYGINDRVKMVGHVADVRSIWAENHLLVLPSRGEGTPLSLVEAMLCGRPAVVTDVGGNADWIEEAKTGFIAGAPTVKLLNDALDKAWLARSDWGKMGFQAHEYAVRRFDKTPGTSLLQLILSESKI